MADEPQFVSDKVQSRFLVKLKKPRREQTRKFDSVESLLNHVDQLKITYGNRRSSKVFDRLKPTLEWLSRFNICVQSYLQASPKAFILLWGSLSVVIQLLKVKYKLSLSYARGLESLTDCLEAITDALPRINSYNRQLAPSDSEILYQTLNQYHEELTGFCYDAETFYQRRFSRNFLRSSCLKADQSGRLQRLRSLTYKFDQEAVFTSFSRIFERLPPTRYSADSSEAMLLGNVPFDNLPCRNHAFYGRQEQLEQINLALCSSSILERTNVGLHGLPGSGKSSLALEYAHRTYADGTYQAVFWLSAETEVKISESLGTIANSLGILDEKRQSDRMLQQRALLQWLARTSKPETCLNRSVKWLVVFDNVSHPSVLDDYWPIVSRGSVIITSRSPEIASQYSKERIYVDTFDLASAADFLISLVYMDGVPHAKENELARAISEAVGNHPLALNMIGSHVRRCGKSIQDFVRDHPQFQRDFIFQSSVESGLHGNKARSVSDVFALTRGADPAMDGHARLLICMLAFLDPDGAPLELFSRHSKEAMLCEGPDDSCKFPNLDGTLQNPFEDCLIFDQTRGILLDLAMINMDGNSAKIKCHRLIQIAAVRTMTEEEIAFVLNKLVFFLNSAFPAQKDGQPLLSQWSKCNEFAASVVSVLGSCLRRPEMSNQPALLAEVVCRCSWYYFEIGWFATATRLADQAIDFCENALATGKHDGYTSWYVRDMISHHFNTKGAIGMKSPQADHGLSMYQTALDIRMQNRREGSDEDEMWIGAAMGNLAISLMAVGRAEEALPKLLELVQRQDMKTNEDLYLSNLCLCFYLLSRFDEALVANEAAANCVRLQWGDDDLRMATLMFYVANVRGSIGDDAGAQDALNKSLGIRLRHMPLHPETGFTHHRMGVFLSHKGDFLQAVEHFAKALGIFSSCEIHPGAVCRTACELRRVTQQFGHLEMAESCSLLADRYLQKIGDLDKSCLGYDASDYDRYVTVGLR